MSLHRPILTLLVFCLAAFTGVQAAPTNSDLSVEWIYSDEGKAARATPDAAWLDDGTALIYDTRQPKDRRTLERFDPTTGKRSAAVDREKSLQSLAEATGGEAPESLDWPTLIEATGKTAIYLVEDDVYLLDLGTSKFKRLTDTEDLVKSARFSPDGKRLAYVRANDLYVWTREDDTHQRLTHDGNATTLNGTVSWVYWEEVFGRQDLGYWWSPDSESIAYLQTDESPVGIMHFVDYSPALPRVIEQRYPKTGTPNPKVRAGVVNVESAKTVWADLGRAPYEYLVRVKWLPDGTRYAVQTLDRPQQNLDFWVVDAASGKASAILRETDPGWVNLHDDLYFLDGGKQFLWASERTGFSHLYLYNIDGTLVRPVTQGEWTLRTSGGGPFWLRQTVPHLDEKKGWLYYTSLEASPVEKHLYRVRLDGTGKERISTDAGTHGINFSPRGDFYFDSFSSASSLPVLRLHSADGKLLRTLSEPADDYRKRFATAETEIFTIPAEDGFPLPAQMVKPANFRANKKYPVVIYVYGGPSAPTVSDSWGSRQFFEHLLAKEGFVAMRIDNRAATAVSKKLENTIAREGYGKVELNDLVAAVHWLKAQSWVDPDRVGVWGWSGGGSYTVLAMTGSKEFRAGIAVAAVTDWAYYDSIWAEAFMKTPQENPEGYEATSHVKRAKDLHGRLMLVHGTYDDNVHPQNMHAFAEELIQAGLPFDMMIYPMRKHGITDDAAQKHLFNKMIDFWKRELMAP